MRTALIISIAVWAAISSILAKEPPVAPQDIVHMVSPRYPSRFQRSRIGGTGRFRMNVDIKTGKVRSVTILKSTGSDALDREGIYTLRQWRFKPGKVTKVDLPITWHNGSEPLVLPPGAVLRPNR